MAAIFSAEYRQLSAGVKISIMMLPITSISTFHPVNHQFVSLKNNASHVFQTQGVNNPHNGSESSSIETLSQYSRILR